MTKMSRLSVAMSNTKNSDLLFHVLLIIEIFIVIAATEIRCQEKSRGGLRYEVIMAEPNLVKSQAPNGEKKKSTESKSLSAHDIEEKLKAAEQRRLV